MKDAGGVGTRRHVHSPEVACPLSFSGLSETAKLLTYWQIMVQRPTAPLLESLFKAAIAAADPAVRVPQHLPPPPKGRTIVVGAGKASAAMAAAVEAHWPGALEGLVVTRYGHGVPCRRIEIVEAAHPVPDRAGSAAAARIAEMVHRLERRRSRPVPDLGRRLGAAGCPGRWPHARRQAGHQPPAPGLGGADFGDELRAQASLGAERRPACRSRLPGQGGVADRVRHSGRRPLAGGFRPDHCGSSSRAEALSHIARYGSVSPTPSRPGLTIRRARHRSRAIPAWPGPRRASSPLRPCRSRRQRGLPAMPAMRSSISATGSKAKAAPWRSSMRRSLAGSRPDGDTVRR